jgi:hypothetical protein
MIIMTFSKKERELLEKIVAKDYKWYKKNFSTKQRRCYFRMLKSRINRKAQRLEEDLKLYHRAQGLDWQYNFY